MNSYLERVKTLLLMVFDHELTKLPENFDRVANSWAAYLQNTLQIPGEDLLRVYTLALDLRNEHKVSAKFRLQDMQAAWTQIKNSENYKKQVPSSVCNLCKNTGYITVYNIQTMREESTKCSH